MTEQHAPQTLIELLAELYVIIDTLQPYSTVRDQIMAALDGAPLPYRSLLPFSVPFNDGDLKALAAQHVELQKLIEGRPNHPLAAAIRRLDGALTAYGSAQHHGEPGEYPVIIERDGTKSWMVHFPDIPEALTCGSSPKDALAEAQDSLLTALSFYFEDKRPVPLPSRPQAGQPVVRVPAILWSRVLLLNAGCDLPCRIPESVDEYDARVEELDWLLRIVGDDEEHPLSGYVARLGDVIRAYDEAHRPPAV